MREEPVTEVPRHRDNSALPLISTDIHDIFDLALNQNFVPVVDDRHLYRHYCPVKISCSIVVISIANFLDQLIF